MRAAAGERTPFHPFCCKNGRSQSQTVPKSPVPAAQAYPAGKRLCGHAAPCPGALRLGEKRERGGTCDAVRNLSCGLLVPGRPATALDRRQRAMPARRTSQGKCVEARSGCSSWRRRRKRSDTVRQVGPLVFETYGRLGGEGTKLLRDLLTTAAAENGQCTPHNVGRWRTQLERVLLTAQADTYLRALGSRVAERPAAEPRLLLAE